VRATTALVPYPTTPELSGAPIGPLLIRGPYAPGATDATAPGFVRGRPYKSGGPVEPGAIEHARPG